MIPLAQADLRQIQLVATDMDGTLTIAEKFAPELLQVLAQTQGWSFTHSTVQCHIKPLQQNKANGLLKVLKEFFPEYQHILTVGDSPNDESLFNPHVFPDSVGVANILNYREQLTHEPAYVTTSPEGKGFCELMEQLKR